MGNTLYPSHRAKNVTRCIPYIADWTKIGEYRQAQTDRNTARKNAQRADHDYVVGDQILVRKDGILCKASPNTLDHTQSQQFIEMEQLGFRREL